VEGGYAAAVLLDGAVLTSAPRPGASIDALRHWLRAAALVRPHTEQGQVLLFGNPAPAPAQALLRFDSVSFADRELDERTHVLLPPAVTMAAISGTAKDISSFLELAPLPSQTRTLGPAPLELPDSVHPGATPANANDQGGAAHRALLIAPLSGRPDLAKALRTALSAYSIRRPGGPVRVVIDPQEFE
jgi:primosomal protein N' (replication factor Y)